MGAPGRRGMQGEGEYLFEYCLDVFVLLGGRAGFCAGGGKVGEDFIVGEDGGLGFEDLRWVKPLDRVSRGKPRGKDVHLHRQFVVNNLIACNLYY